VKIVVALGKPGMFFTPEAIEGLKELIGTEMPVKAEDKEIGQGKVVGVTETQGLPALEVEVGDELEEMVTPNTVGIGLSIAKPPRETP
jgi:hypothetical protein